MWNLPLLYPEKPPPVSHSYKKKYNKETLANVSIKNKKNGKFRKEAYHFHFLMTQIEFPEILQEKKMKETLINVSF